jgi:hypothetical protein
MMQARRPNGGGHTYFNAERRAAFVAATWPERLSIHERVAAKKAAAMEARRDLARRYLERHAADVLPLERVPWRTAKASLDLSAETRAAREEAVALAHGRAAHVNNVALEFPVLGEDFAADAAAVRLAMSPLVLVPLVRYFGVLPVFFNMFVTRAHNTELKPNSAHLFHLDPEDVVSHKVFIHLTDVDEGCGPFHALDADASQTVMHAVGYKAIDRVSDERVRELVGWRAVTPFFGRAGTVVFADTTRCLHFGGRPRDAGKPVREMLVFQYLLPTSYLFPLDGDAADPRHLPNLTPTGDDHWDALIGARFT